MCGKTACTCVSAYMCDPFLEDEAHSNIKRFRKSVNVKIELRLRVVLFSIHVSTKAYTYKWQKLSCLSVSQHTHTRRV